VDVFRAASTGLGFNGSMENLSAKLEKLLTEAENCDLIGRLATDSTSANSSKNWPTISAR
jgi:hypothetical protein